MSVVPIPETKPARRTVFAATAAEAAAATPARACAGGGGASPARRLLVLALSLGVCADRAGARLPKRFLIASSPAGGAIVYTSLPRGGGLRQGAEVQVLLNQSESIEEPMGIAVDQSHNRLFIADTALRHIVSYKLHHSNDPNYLGITSPKIYAPGTEVRWLTVDSAGNLFFTNEATNQILWLSYKEQMKSDPEPEVMYNGSSVAAVSMPGGIAVDDYRVYWVNKQLGTTMGSVVRAPKTLTGGVDPSVLMEPLVWNSDKSYGLCSVMKNVFYTHHDGSIFGVLKTGDGLGGFGTVTNRLTQPRGCAFDGDGTVYVADRGANAIYSFAGVMQKLGHATITRTATVDDAFGVAVYSGARRGSGIVALLVGLASVFAAFAFSGVLP